MANNVGDFVASQVRGNSRLIRIYEYILRVLWQKNQIVML